MITCYRPLLAAKTSVQRVDNDAFKLYVTLLISPNSLSKQARRTHTNVAKKGTSLKVSRANFAARADSLVSALSCIGERSMGGAVLFVHESVRDSPFVQTSEVVGVNSVENICIRLVAFLFQQLHT